MKGMRVLRSAVASCVAMLTLACAGQDLAGVVAPLGGSPAMKASYAYSTQWGDMYEVEGELVPAGYGRAWDPVINSQRSSINTSGDCSFVACDILFDAQMTGLWHSTTQTINWRVGDHAGSSTKRAVGWDCVARLSATHCLLAERKDQHRVSITDCQWVAKLNTAHSAFWGAWFDLQSFTKVVGVFGRTETASVSPDLNYNECRQTGGGGSGGPSACYDMFLYWYDVKGYHEVYVGTFCRGGGGDAM